MLGLDISLSTACVTLALIALTWYFIRKKTGNKTVSYGKIDIRGKTVIVTGSNTGIGKATAKQLAKLGARVILACRDLTKANAADDDIRTTVHDACLIVKHLDLGDLASVKKFCDDLIRSKSCVDVLINNASSFALPKMMLEDGTELQFVTNHLGHHLLTRLLLPVIQRSDIKRVVILSSLFYRIGTIKFGDDGQLVPNGGIKQYANTKLMNCLLATEVHRRFSSSHGVSAYALHPGVVNTTMHNNFLPNAVKKLFKPLVMFVGRNFYATVEKGCETSVYCATAKGLEEFSGKYFDNCQLCPWHLNGMDGDVARRLWDYCEAKVHNYL